MSSRPAKPAENPFVLNESKTWSWSIKCIIVWLIMNLTYLIFYILSLASYVMGLVVMRSSILDTCVMIVRAMIFTSIHLTVLVRRRVFCDVASRLFTGQLNLYEDKRLLKRRVNRCIVVLVLCYFSILTLNVTEAVFSFHAPEFLYELVDRVTFGSSNLMGETLCRYALLVDNFFYTSFNFANIALLALCLLLSLTLAKRVQIYGENISSIPILTDEILKDTHDTFQRIQTDIRNVNDAFSALFFLWYFEALVSAFNGIQYFTKGGLGVFSPIYAGSMFFQSTLAVLIETYVASKIPSNIEQSRFALMNTSRRSRFDYLSLELYLLSKQMSSSENALSAAGFFLITRSICLSFIGFLVTYLLVLLSSRNI